MSIHTRCGIFLNVGKERMHGTHAQPWTHLDAPKGIERSLPYIMISSPRRNRHGAKVWRTVMHIQACCENKISPKKPFTIGTENYDRRRSRPCDVWHTEMFTSFCASTHIHQLLAPHSEWNQTWGIFRSVCAPLPDQDICLTWCYGPCCWAFLAGWAWIIYSRVI